MYVKKCLTNNNLSNIHGKNGFTWITYGDSVSHLRLNSMEKHISQTNRYPRTPSKTSFTYLEPYAKDVVYSTGASYRQLHLFNYRLIGTYTLHIIVVKHSISG